MQGWKTFNLVATFVTDLENVGSNEPGKREEILSKMTYVVPKIRKILEVPNEWRRWVLGDRDPIPSWVDGNVALLGDAAHPTYQYFAQGACMAMEDAVCLSDKFEKCGGDLRPPSRPTDHRIPRAYRVVLSSRELGRIFHVDGVERLVRNAWLHDKTPEEFNQSVRWIYGGNGLTGAKTGSAERAA